jgi:general secretion pathway protein G
MFFDTINSSPRILAIGLQTRMQPKDCMVGFTLIELLVAVAIVGLLASIALPLSEISVRRTKEQELQRSLIEIRNAIDAYKRAVDTGRIVRQADQSGYPPTLEILVSGVPDATDTRGAPMYFLRRVRRDPFHPDVSVSPERTWGLRSYESPPERPQAGRDVFDVYSLSEGIGINSIPYREW